jgi:ectoine hydroxylase-related dioxygenase (phytanoyl-CoA dioxygenase family)
LTSKHGGNGPTHFHQDYVSFALDRSGGMTFWLALENYGPGFGTMSFVDSSHRCGVLGDYRTYPPGEDLLDVFPDLREDFAITPPMIYAAGDVTVHSHMIVHGAGANQTERPRWAYIVSVQPEDVHWTGGVSVVFDTAGMTLNQRLPDDRFPILA